MISGNGAAALLRRSARDAIDGRDARYPELCWLHTRLLATERALLEICMEDPHRKDRCLEVLSANGVQAVWGLAP